MKPLRPWLVLALSASALAVSAILGAQAQTGQTQSGQTQPSRPGQQPTRDTSAQPAADAVPKGRIAGRILAADTGRPVRRARVFLSGTPLPGGRGALTDDDGLFELTELPEGRYTLTAGKTGFLTLSYGQRRPLQSGTPIQLADGQQLTRIDFRLPRGSVITGHVYDESGDPLPGAAVRVVHYEYAQGNRQLVPVGNAQTDDLGAYRVWGLNPGEYFVSATASGAGMGGRGFGPGGGPQFGRGGTVGRTGSGAPETAAVSYAPTFYPGVASVGEARPVTLGLTMEVPSIDFAVMLVRTARISGHVVNPDGTPVTSGNIALLTESAASGRGARGDTAGSRINWDGAFAMAGVAPGRYVLRARGEDSVQPQFASMTMTVADVDTTNLTVILAPAASISGTVLFQNTQSQQTPDPTQVRVAAPATDSLQMGPNATTRVERDGTFTLNGVQAGLHLLRTQSAPRGWMLKSATVNGRDVIDTPFELRSGEALSGVGLVFTDKLTTVSGTITDSQTNPITDYTLLAFPDDESLWRPQSRQIMTARPDQNGTYQIRGLPPGSYHIVAVDPAEQGEWFEPAYLEAHLSGSTRLQLTEGDTKTQDFKVNTR
jgi:hypothetical protein